MGFPKFPQLEVYPRVPNSLVSSKLTTDFVKGLVLIRVDDKGVFKQPSPTMKYFLRCLSVTQF